MRYNSVVVTRVHHHRYVCVGHIRSEFRQEGDWPNAMCIKTSKSRVWCFKLTLDLEMWNNWLAAFGNQLLLD